MTFDEIAKITRIFESKNWELDEINEYSKFNRICKMIELLKDDKEKKLLLTLIKDFLHITQGKYGDTIIRGLNQLIKSNPQTNLFYVLPLLAEKDLGKNKSSFMVHYLFKGTTMKQKLNMEKVAFRAIDKASQVPNGKKVILVDDFVGTGDTAIEAIDYVLKVNPNIKVDDIIILSIVALRTGCLNLSSYGIQFYYSIQAEKGITDNNDEADAKEYLEVMERIENRLKKLEPDFKFGYKKSEALVCMERAPNNTFPIFWLVDNKHKPPFPR